LPKEEIGISHVHYRIVVFDVEGVLVPRIIFYFKIAWKVGYKALLYVGFIAALYQLGLIRSEKALKKIFKALKGTSMELLKEKFLELPLTPGTERTLRTLKRIGIKVALLSSGIPALLVRDLARRLGADYALGPKVEVRDGVLTGNISGKVISARGKAETLRRLLVENGIPGAECAFIADDKNNIPALKICGLKIGFNPDFRVSLNVNFIVSDSLDYIVPLITGDLREKKRKGVAKNLISREIVHLSGILAPFISIYLVDKRLLVFILTVVSTAYLYSESSRILKGLPLPVFGRVTALCTSRAEVQGFVSAPLFYACGIIAPLILFPEPASFVSIAVLTLGDSSASIVGSTIGKINLPFNRKKSLEGTLAGFFMAFLGSSLFVSFDKAAVAALAGTALEALPTPLDDNLTVPLFSGLILTLLP